MCHACPDPGIKHKELRAIALARNRPKERTTVADEKSRKKVKRIKETENREELQLKKQEAVLLHNTGISIASSLIS